MTDLRRALRDGAMVVVPLGAVILLVLGIIHRLEQAADPLAGRFVHPVVVAILMLILLCLIIGFLVRSATGRWARDALETAFLGKIPGFRLMKAFSGGGPFLDHRGGAGRPALVAIEGGHSPALVMEAFADGRLMVFVPSVPVPMSGSIYIFPPEKVTLLDVPLIEFVEAISSWGLGLRDMMEQARPDVAGGRPMP